MAKPPRVYLTNLFQPELIGKLSQLPHDPRNAQGMARLRRYILKKKINFNTKNDFKTAMAVARFTSMAWNHDGFPVKPGRRDALTLLKLAEKGAGFSCLEYATVFVQLCHAIGIPARVLNIRTKKSQYGSSGHGHWTAEYFDNQFKKWVWIDPQIHAYAGAKEQPLSFNQFAELVVGKKNPRIKFTDRTLKYLNNDRKGLKSLSGFIRRYVWDSQVSGLPAFFKDQSSVEIIGCKRRDCLPSITFQGFAARMPQYVSSTLFDAPLNSCQMAIETLAPRKPIQWVDLKDYRLRASRNFAMPRLNIHLQNSMPWFAYYIVLFNGKKTLIKRSDFKLTLKTGKNNLSVCPVNLMGRSGVPSTATIHFDSRYSNVKNYW